ncbi:RagB/SusD family nutrient uptake outer membrane protein [Sphingobacterium sp. ML3W]|nr:RagB/SusD family nutrient uptake outer membrane protein [Sphingobacterium sp. ML3W]WFA81350.1 RagB/SusD family nutrient uptake outer membrane protein [Sphingobacterium sp. ML3W]
MILLLTASCMMWSCNSFLDTTPEDLRSPEQIFSTYTSTQNAMFGVYSYIRKYNPMAMPSTVSTSDVDVVYTNVTTFDMGTWTASAAPYDKWNTFYQAIREANYFLQNLDKCPESELASDMREQWRAEVRTLRAYYYAQLMRMYGPVILLGDELPDFTAVDMQRPRNSWDECVQWVTSEFSAMANNSYLPVVQEGNNYARMSQAIALAYRARILLQSASDQFNGNPMYTGIKNSDGKALFPATKDPNKWKLAREAAEDVIKLGYYNLVKVNGTNGTIDPYASYKAVFTTAQNKEMIFSYLEDDGYVDKRLAPNSNGGWGGGYNPTQEMVDLYAMNNGRYPIKGYLDADRNSPDIDAQAGYSETGFTNFTHPIEKVQRSTFNMFVNREPRFYVSVLYGGISWFVANKSSEKIYLEMFKNGNNGPDASHNYFSTGYNMAKLAMPEYEANPTKNIKREVPYMRYAEILLNYVEASIEMGDLSNTNLFTYWNMVRERAGLPNIEQAYPEAAGNKQKLIELLRRERRIEFAFEGMSFYDTRRWLIAEQTERGAIHGMNVKATGTRGSNSYPADFFKRTVLEKRIFTPSYYLYPIPQSDLNKNFALVQNYKW